MALSYREIPQVLLLRQTPGVALVVQPLRDLDVWTFLQFSEPPYYLSNKFLFSLSLPESIPVICNQGNLGKSSLSLTKTLPDLDVPALTLHSPGPLPTSHASSQPWGSTCHISVSYLLLPSVLLAYNGISGWFSFIRWDAVICPWDIWDIFPKPLRLDTHAPMGLALSTPEMEFNTAQFVAWFLISLSPNGSLLQVVNVPTPMHMPDREQTLQ